MPHYLGLCSSTAPERLPLIERKAILQQLLGEMPGHGKWPDQFLDRGGTSRQLVGGSGDQYGGTFRLWCLHGLFSGKEQAP